MVITIIIIGLLILLLVFFFYFLNNYLFLKKVSKDSLIVFGKKGHGKSLLFSVLAKSYKKNGYCSNTDFGFSNQILISPSDVSISPNKWDNILENNFYKIEKKPFEGKPILLDDAGIFLPSYYDNLLKKQYPSMPGAFAIWRHLYNAPIHINSQSVSRTWLLLREQADGFIKCRRVRRFGPIAIINCTYYDRIDSATREVAPLKKLLLNKFSSADYQAFISENGIVKDFSIFVWLPHHKYNSRYFSTLLFDEEQQKEEK